MLLEGNILKCAGDFKVLKTLAHSGFSSVYLAQESNTGKQYALKAIKNPNNKYRINNEINIYKIVNTFDNILKLCKVFKDDKKLFFVYELSSDKDLDHFVAKEGNLDENTIFKVLTDVLKTLKQAHCKNIIHNDIKPDNILLNNDKYCLSDWGLSKQNELIKIIDIKSDNNYTAPEIYKGFANKSSDIYSLGATLYNLATGRVVYDLTYDDDFAYKMYAHHKLDIDLSSIKSDKLKYIITEMTQKDYKKRITIEELEKLISKTEVNFSEEIKDVNYSKYKEKLKKDLYLELSKDEVCFAQNSLGTYYFNKDNNEYNNKSFEYYEKAAKNGLIKAYYNLGICYKKGIGVNVDIEKSLKCFKNSAIKNHAKSIYMVAMFYEKGMIVEKNEKKAQQLYYESASHGYKKAYKKLNNHDLNNQ